MNALRGMTLPLAACVLVLAAPAVLAGSGGGSSLTGKYTGSNVGTWTPRAGQGGSYDEQVTLTVFRTRITGTVEDPGGGKSHFRCTFNKTLADRTSPQSFTGHLTATDSDNAVCQGSFTGKLVRQGGVWKLTLHYTARYPAGKKKGAQVAGDMTATKG